MMLLSSQFFRFATVGGIATAAQYAILYALVSGAAWDAAHASMLGAAIGALLNYWLNYTFSFRSDRKHRESFPLFALMASCGTVLNGLIVKGLTLAGLYFMLAQVVATIVVLGFNFYVSRKWIFVQTR
jgi:putative flippase GtrA